MSGADPYEAWRKQRGDVQVGPGFSDRVMGAIDASERPRGLTEPRPHGRLRSVFHYVAATALVAASVLAGVLRLESVAALILLFSSKGY